MLGAHLSAPDLAALQAALLNEGAGIIPLRAFEHAAGAGHFIGLAVLAPGHELLHFVADVHRVPRGEGQMKKQDDFIPAGIGAAPVPQGQLLSLQAPGLPGKSHVVAGNQHFLHFAAISPGVHISRAAGASGDAPGEFQPRQAVFPGKHAHRRQRGSGSAPDTVFPFPGNRGELPAQGNHYAPNAFIRHQQVGALPQQIHRGFRLPAQPHKPPKLAHSPRRDQQVRRPSNAEGGVLRHGLLHQAGTAHQRGFPLYSFQRIHIATTFLWFVCKMMFDIEGTSSARFSDALYLKPGMFPEIGAEPLF